MSSGPSEDMVLMTLFCPYKIIRTVPVFRDTMQLSAYRSMAKKKCPHCGKEVNIIPFGNRFIAVCCNEILYVGHEPPAREEADPSIEKPGPNLTIDQEEVT